MASQPARQSSTTNLMDGPIEASRRAGETIRTAFHRASDTVSDAVSDAMTVAPKVGESDDPTSLSTPVGPLSADLYVEAARLAHQQGNLASATEQYEKALGVDPNNRRALIGFARLNEHQGDTAKAVTLYQQAIQADPGNPMAYNDLGLCYSLHNRTQEGVTVLGQAVELDPQNKRFRNNLAIALVDAERYDEALMHLRAAHSPAEAHHNLACLLRAHGKEELATEHFARSQHFSTSVSSIPAAGSAAVLQRQAVPQVERPVASGAVQMSPVILSPSAPWQSHAPGSSAAAEMPAARTATLQQDSAAARGSSDVRRVDYVYDPRQPPTSSPGDHAANIDGTFFDAGHAPTRSLTHLPLVE